MKPIIWPQQPQISSSSTISVSMHPHSLSSAAFTPLELEVSWDVDIGSYSHVPDVRLNASYADTIFINPEVTPPLLPLAVALVLTNDACYRRFTAIAASGEQAYIPAGPVVDRRQAPLGHGSKFWVGDIVSAPTSSAAGAGFYATLSELGVAFNKTYLASGLQDALRATADPIRLSDADDAHEWLIYLLRRLFMNFTTQNVVDYLTSIRYAFLQNAIESIEYAAEADTFTVSVSQGFAHFLSAHGEAWSVMPNFLSEVASAWLTDCETAGKFVTVAERKLQYVDPNGAYAKWFSSSTRKLRVVCLDEPSFALDAVEDCADATPFDEDDIASEPDIARIFKEGQNDRLWIPQGVTSDPNDCGKLEESGSPIAYAAESGLVSQTKLANVNDALLKYPTLSEKQRDKQYSRELIRPAIADPLTQSEFTVSIPKYDKKLSSQRYCDAAAALYANWWDDIGATLSAEIAGRDTKPYFEYNGQQYLIDRSSYTWRGLVTLNSLPDEAALRLLWVLTSQNEDLWRHVIMLQPSKFLTCIPASEFRDVFIPVPSRATYCTFDCSALDLSRGSYLTNITGVCAVFALEWQHCVDAYKKRAEDYKAIPGLVGGGPADSYWWLLLELIPLTILIVAIAADGGERKQSRNEV